MAAHVLRRPLAAAAVVAAALHGVSAEAIDVDGGGGGTSADPSSSSSCDPSFFHPGRRVLRLLPRRLRRRLTGTRLLSDPPPPPPPRSHSSRDGGVDGGECYRDTLPPARQLRVTPRRYGGDPTGRTDSTSAVLHALAVCVNASRYTPGTFPDGARDAGGCNVDLDGGEYLVSETIRIPAYVSNLRVGWGSLVANVAGNWSAAAANEEDDATEEEDGVASAYHRAAAARKGAAELGGGATKFMIVVGGDVPCDNFQGSCNEDVGFPALFLDGSNVASGVQVNHVMGTTIGPQTYLLNFTGYGIQVVGGHEVMIDQTWLGETNFDHRFSEDMPPKATAIQINSNDHYVLDSIVFSSLVGLDMKGAANVVNGLHVWFPWNEATNFGATAFLDTASQNRYTGCYIDGSRAVFRNPTMLVWKFGFNLGGAGFQISGNVRNLEMSGNEFWGGTIRYVHDDDGPPGSVVDAVIAGNLFRDGGAGRGSRASRTSTSSDPGGMFELDFCDDLVFGNITRVRASFVTAPGSGDVFPVAAARAPEGCKVRVDVRPPAAGTVLVDVDTSEYDNSFAQ